MNPRRGYVMVKLGALCPKDVREVFTLFRRGGRLPVYMIVLIERSRCVLRCLAVFCEVKRCASEI